MDIKKMIEKKGFSMAEVADKLGKNRMTLYQNISGNPTVKTMREIADVIGCHVTDFFADEIAPELTAFVEYEGNVYKATTKRELRDITDKICNE